MRWALTFPVPKTAWRSLARQRHPTTCGLAPTISMSRQVTVSQQVTTSHGTSQLAREKLRCHGLSEQSRTEPPYPTWGMPALKRPFLGIRGASIHGGSSLLWISASATSGERPRMVDHWSLGISLVLQPTGRTSRDAALRRAGRRRGQGKSGRAVAFACGRGGCQQGARNACGTSRRLCKV